MSDPFTESDELIPRPPGDGRFGVPLVWDLPMPIPVPRRKFQHNYRLHLILFLLTFLTTTYRQVFGFFWLVVENGRWDLLRLLPKELWAIGLDGLWYSIPLLVILGAHEFGHYLMCRRHDVDATLPYFIPAPMPLTGTFGAVIRIREVFPSKKALFDIGVAGPIAGFLALLPFLFWGVAHSTVTQISGEHLEFGEPLLYKIVQWLQFGPMPAGHEVALHDTAFAAWWGMLATALNLMPFGQLDGGHIVYSILGPRAKYVSMATIAAAVILTLISLSWISVTIMMLVMAFFLGVRHPHIMDEDTPLDGRRQLVAFAALVIFVLCFMPVPIDTFFGK